MSGTWRLHHANAPGMPPVEHWQEMGFFSNADLAGEAAGLTAEVRAELVIEHEGKQFMRARAIERKKTLQKMFMLGPEREVPRRLLISPPKGYLTAEEAFPRGR